MGTSYLANALLPFNSGSVLYGYPSYTINGDNTVITIPETGYYLVSYVVYGFGLAGIPPGVALQLNNKIVQGSSVLGTYTVIRPEIGNTNMVNTMLINVTSTNSTLSIIVTGSLGAEFNDGYNRLTIIKVF